jgi:hypothetical protein
MREAPPPFIRPPFVVALPVRKGDVVAVPCRFLLPVALVLAALPGTASGEDEPLPAGGEELVVVSSTVAKDREDPASFSDFDAEEIQSINAGQDLSTLLGETMNAYSYSDAGNGYGYSYLRIRGFDQARIAVNVNGVPLNTPGIASGVFDRPGRFRDGFGDDPSSARPRNGALRLARGRGGRQSRDRADPRR